MARVNAALHAFNRGVISPRALGRVDVEKLRLAAEKQTNWLPTVLGPMMLRPGMEYVGTTRGNAKTYFIPFVFSNDDWAIIELTDIKMRVRLPDESLVSFDSVSTTVVNGDFSSATGWNLTAGGTSTAQITNGALIFSGASVSGTAKCDRSVSVAAGDQGKRHCLKIVVDRGPVLFRAGTSAGDDSYITTTSLDTGTHYLALTPTGSTFYVQFESTDKPGRIVNSITIFTGTLEIDTPWGEVSHLPLLRHEQSGDVVFVTCHGVAPRRIERRSTHSWSIVTFKTADGPFLSGNDETITITPSALSGEITLTANRSLFRSGHAGALFRLFHTGQNINSTLNNLNDVSDTIRVTGVTTSRKFTYTATFNSFVGTITLQRSFDGPESGFTDVSSFTTDQNTSLQDTFDNSIAWYRFKVTAKTSGSGAVVTMSYPGGGGAGICRILTVTNGTTASAEVLKSFLNTTATTDWLEGAWSNYRGWPSAVRLHEGRLCLPTGDVFRASMSDAYTSFDIDATGDSAPIDRAIGYGPVDTINDLISLGRLLLLREGSETSVRSSSLDEPLTVTNTNFKDVSTLGSARLPALKVDQQAIFVQQSKRRIFAVGYDATAGEYRSHELTRLATDICSGDVVALAVQRQPDTRMHFVLSDGTVAVLVYDLDDEVVAWWKIETDGAIENVVVMPGSPEDKVYYVVRRTINGSTVRYIERHARMDQCTGLPEARCADAHKIYSGAATTTITGLSHLEGESVVAWGYASGATTGRDLGTYTVSGGQITGLPVAVVWACVGLAYTADFRSTKLAYGAQGGTSLTQRKRAIRLGLIARNTHYRGIKYGSDENNLDDLPAVEDGAVTASDTVWDSYDQPMFALSGTWDTDSRLHLRAQAPRPAEIMAAVIQVQTNE